ncbi:MAG TPA: hypothetical protein VGR78_18930 [Verrucomicrobiae bacterium]|jgi:hypothetical protein|nr:hypothetical protein [Verrucomicrobiae bacterium]
MSTEVIEPIETRAKPNKPLTSTVTGRLAKRLAARIRSSGDPLIPRIISWINLVDLGREWDDTLMGFDQPSTERLSLHEGIVSLSIERGTLLLGEIRTSNSDISGSGYNFDRLEASVGLLRVFYNSHHPKVPDSELETIRQRIFNAAA